MGMITAQPNVLFEHGATDVQSLYEMLCREKTVEKVLQDDFASVQFFTAPLGLEACRLFERFMKEDLQYREQWMFDIPGNGDPDLGYLPDRDGKDKDPRTMTPQEKADRKKREDKKSLMHLNHQVRKKLQIRRVNYERHEKLLQIGEKIELIHDNLAHAFARRQDELVPGFHFEERLEDAKQDHISFLRLAIYHNEPEKDEDAADIHTDRAAWTQQLIANRHGLVIRDRKGVAHEPDETRLDDVLIFFGKKMTKITKGLHPGAPHYVKEVRRSPEEIAKDPSKRVAAIWFAHALA